MSEFMKNIAEEAANLPKKQDTGILTRPLKPKLDAEPPKENSAEAKSKENSTDKPKAKQKIKESAQTEIAELTDQISELKKQIKQLTEKKSEQSKYAFAEGATATNPSTGKKIVFSKGEWWYLDGDQ